MEIILYKVNTSKDHLRRWDDSEGATPPPNKTVEGTLTQETDFLRPSIVLHDMNTPVKTFNYCFIAEFGRWYFIDNYTQINNSTVQIDCSVDVAWTYYNDIKLQTGEIDRSTNLYSDTVSDANTTILANSKISEINFPNGLGTNGWYGVLVTTG